MNGADPLSQLKDIHLPPAISAWPPAPGWWLLAALVLAAAAFAGRLFLRRWRYRRAARQAAAELRALAARYRAEGDAMALARALSPLLRQAALAYFPRTEVAGLTGENWLAFLDRSGGGGRFAAGPGRALVDAPYRPGAAVAAEALLAACAAWLAALPGEARRA